MSITEQDIKVLRKTSSKSFRLAFTIMACFLIVVFLITAGLNIYFCHRLALMEGLTITDIFVRWTKGISLSEQYSGKLLSAIQRLQTALTSIVLAIIFGLLLWFKQSASKRNARILRFIEEKRN